MYRNLNPDRIVETSEALARRIRERFPGAGLGRVAEELLTVTRESSDLALWLSSPIKPLRIFVVLAISALVLVVLGAILTIDLQHGFGSLADVLQGVEAAVNDIVFVGIAIYFLATIETRIKRRRALKAIHVLRSMAHIIDMHQLPKDPERLTARRRDTESSPKVGLTPYQLTRYLDYCSEMLAILGKNAALCVQGFEDPVALAAVNDIENLVGGLSRKIWQKIMILDRIIASESPDGAEIPANRAGRQD